MPFLRDRSISGKARGQEAALRAIANLHVCRIEKLLGFASCLAVFYTSHFNGVKVIITRNLSQTFHRIGIFTSQHGWIGHKSDQADPKVFVDGFFQQVISFLM